MTVFFDTNVLVYTQDPLDPDKQAVARALVEQAIVADEFTISTQVMQEFYAVATRRRLLLPAQAVALLQTWAANDVVHATPDLLLRAVGLQQSRQMSVWDALVVQAALDAGCSTLYSEDLQDGMDYGGLQVVNPFAGAATAHDPPPAYRAASKRSARR